MSARDWRARVIEAEGKDFDELAYTVETYKFLRNKRPERVFKERELPNQAYYWID